ncbi:MAG: acyltransferase family protein [Anaeromyxobacter sp.]
MQERHGQAALGLAAVAAVMAARYQPAFLFYPVAAFSAGFLFLAAGFAAPRGRSALLGAAGRWAAVAWAGAALAVVLAVPLARAGLPPPGAIPGGAGEGLLQAALAPLGLASAPGLFPAGWVLAAAAAGLALFSVLAPAPGRASSAWIGAATAALVAAAAGGDGRLEPGGQLLLARLAFALAFLLLGAALAASPALARRLRAPAVLVGGFLLVDTIAKNGGGLGYAIERGSLGGSPGLALVTTAAIALMGWSLAGYAAEVVPPRSALLAVGRAWVAVLALHAAVLFLVDLAFVGAGLLAAADLPTAARTFKLDRWWLLYLVPAIGLPVLRLRRRFAAATLRTNGREGPSTGDGASGAGEGEGASGAGGASKGEGASGGRLRHVDVMLAFGIVMVVMGHHHQPPYLFLDAYTFHMPLFFFASGYLATAKEGLGAKLRFLGGKARGQLLLYFRWNLFFAVLTFLLALAGVRLGYAIPAFGTRAEVLASLRGFFVQPFEDGHQYHLYLAAWFILQLFLVHVAFQVVVWRPGKAWATAALAVVAALLVPVLEAGLQSFEDLRLTGVRTALALFFFLAGHVVRLHEGRLARVLLAPWSLVAAFALVNVLAVNLGNIRYNFVLGNVSNVRVWVPVATSLLIVLMVFQLAHHAARFLPDRSPVYLLGRSTLDVLVWHFTVFLAVNAVLCALGLVPFEKLSDNWYAWEREKSWLLYEVPALVFPVLLRRWLDRRRGLVAAAAQAAARPARRERKARR